MMLLADLTFTLWDIAFVLLVMFALWAIPAIIVTVMVRKSMKVELVYAAFVGMATSTAGWILSKYII